jgi:hypothetical protein
LIATKKHTINIAAQKLSLRVNSQEGEIKWLLGFVLGATLVTAVDPMVGVCTTAAIGAAIVAWVLVWPEETGRPMPGMPSARLVVSSNEDSLRVSRRWCAAWHLAKTPEQHLCRQGWQDSKEQ